MAELFTALLLNHSSKSGICMSLTLSWLEMRGFINSSIERSNAINKALNISLEGIDLSFSSLGIYPLAGQIQVGSIFYYFLAALIADLMYSS